MKKITFIIGPEGSGKTELANALRVQMLDQHGTNSLILEVKKYKDFQVYVDEHFQKSVREGDELIVVASGITKDQIIPSPSIRIIEISFPTV